jgi:4-amino-4-deoxy-L-arabinose transferase-like glycosyltransferase
VAGTAPASRIRVDVRLLLAGALALAIAVRMVGIGSRLTVDEAYTWLVASSSNAHVFLHRLAASENTPPLFYLLVMLMPGDAPAWLRLPAAIPGILMSAVLFLALRPRLGDRAALLAALAVGVSPYLITYSDLARGFMLADLALLVALWALLGLGEEESRARWAAFWLAAVVAVYTEYSSAICLAALVLACVWIGTPPRRATLLAGALALAAIAPWIPQIVRGQNQVGVTKFEPMNALTSLTGLREIVVSLTFGESGGVGAPDGRWLEFGVLLGAGAAVALVLRRGWFDRAEPERRTIRLLAGAAVLTLAGYAVAGAAGLNVFTPRYLTILVPLLAGPVAAAVAQIERRRVLSLAAVLLAGLGVVEVARRYRGEWQPDLTPVRLAATAMRPRTVLTNTPLVLYYLRSLRPALDRPYNLGPGRAGTCTRPCVIVDDTRVPGGTPRPASESRSAIGPFVLTLER